MTALKYTQTETPVPDMEPTCVGEVGNYYGGLWIKAKRGKMFWSIENWDGHNWVKCPEPVFAALASLQKKEQTDAD